MEDSLTKAKTLIEALPYIRAFANQTVVIKYGGHAMVDEELKKNFALDIILMQYIGIKPVVVHGGGPQINRFLAKMQITPSYVQGMRVTDEETMDVVEMVLGGKVNKEIVSLINHHGGRAVGLSGRDGNLLQAEKMRIIKAQPEKEEVEAELIDLGRVGRVVAVDSGVLESLEARGFIPVIAPVGVGKDGQAYNINADLVAGAVAAKLKAAKLILLTDVEGVLDRDGKLISSILAKEVEAYISAGVVTGGMIPKLRCCLEAVAGGVGKAHIIDGRKEHAILLEMFTRSGVGSEVTLA